MPDPSTSSDPTPRRAIVRVQSDVPIWDSDRFEHAQRVALVLARSQLVPEHLRGEEHLSDLVLLCLMAQARGEHPLSLAQSVYFVSGRAGFAAIYLIAQANKAGVFRGRIGWDVVGAGATLVVTARATLAETGEIVAVAASMVQAQREGWTRNAKYQSMPEQMLRYRSACALIRLYCPEVILAGGGLPAVEELEPAPPIPTGQAERIAEAVERAGRALPPPAIEAAPGRPPEPPVREPTVAPAPPAPPKAEGDAPHVALLREELRGFLRQRPDACAAKGVNNAHGIARGGEAWLRTTLAAVQEEIAREDEVARGRQGWTLADGGGREGVAREDAAAVRPGLAAADDDPAEGPQNSLFGED